ncbi:MAG: hypothetical protein AB8F95_04835 [Bacteroidia bacterium]
MRISTFFVILFLPLLTFAQFNTPSLVDAGVQAAEYGTHSEGVNLQSSAGQSWHVTWNNDSLFVAVTGGFNPGNDAVNFYIDIDPQIPVNSNLDADGSIIGPNFDQTDAQLPFRADAFIFVKQGYDDYRLDNGQGGWTGKLGDVTKNIGFGTPNYVEFGIAWAKLTGAGRPAAFNFMGYISYDNGGFNGTFAAVPTGNPTHASNGQTTQYLTHYYSITNTNNTTATAPFSQTSFTYREFGTGGYFLPKGEFYDVTVHQNANTLDTENENSVDLYNNTDTDNRILIGGDALDTLAIGRHLYIGVNSAVLPADNTGGINDPRGGILYFDGPACRLYNFGRIDANPEAGSLIDIGNRVLYIEVRDTLTLMPNANMVPYRYRLGSIKIAPGAVMRADPAAPIPAPITYDEFELQWGTLDVQGTLDLGDGTAGSFKAGLRGSWNSSPDNDYIITSGGGTPNINFYHLQIGRWTSFLRADTSGTGPALTLNIKGDFRNFSNFVPVDGTAELNLRFCGLGAQLIEGTIGETAEPTKAVAPATGASPTVALPVQVQFNDIEIDNNSGLDVSFISYEPTIPTNTNISYEILGELKLTNGDLVTRDRANPTAARAVHVVRIDNAAPVPVFTGARSEVGAAISCFVDGPLSYEVNGTGTIVREFPIGKTTGGVGDYRHASASLNYTGTGNAVYTAEMFITDYSAAYGFPVNACPDVLGRISTVRYWDITSDNATGFTTANVTVAYDVNEADDGVTNATEVRLLKDAGSFWANVSCGQGGTANGTGTITSLPVTSVGEFILAFPPNIILDGEVLVLKGEVENGQHRLSWQEPETRQGVYILYKDGEAIFHTKTGEISYEWSSAFQQNKKAKYHLMWIDPNGEAYASNSVELNAMEEDKLLVYVHDQKLYGKAPGAGSLTIYTLEGKQVFENMVVENAFEISLSGISKGMYQVVWNGSGSRLVKKIMVR